MKKCSLCFLFVIATLLCASMALAGNGYITPEDIASEPDRFVTVINEPNPALVDTLYEGGSRYSFWLTQRDGQYALFFSWKGGSGRGSAGWRDWTVDGNELSSGDGGRIWIDEDGDVYFQYGDSRRVELEPAD